MEYKQVIVLRNDLGMGKGKLAAQCAHASLEAALSAGNIMLEEWRMQGAKKVALKIDSEKAILELFRRAKAAKVVCALIKDAGHTQIPAGSVTALAIGPAKESDVDALTKELKLL